MNILTKSKYVLALVAGLMTAVAMMPAASFADVAPTFTTSETTANVIAGANTQTLTATTTTANVAQVKATRTLTVGSAPTNAQNFTIGLCVVTFATTTNGVGTAQDIICSDNAATIRTTTGTASDTPRTAAEIATALQSLTGVSDTGHGALTISSSTATNVIFTTTGAESTTTAITYGAGTASGITSTSSTAGTVPVAQVTQLVPANVEQGDRFTATINSLAITGTSTASTTASANAALTAAINASAQASNVTAVDQTATTSVTSDIPGTAFTISTGTTNRAAAAQVVTFTPTNIGDRDTFTLTLNGTAYSVVSDNDTTQTLVENITSQLSAQSAATCNENDVMITCTANVAGTSFSYSATVVDAVISSTSSHSSGGGGHHRSTSSSSTTTSTVATPTGTAAVTTTTTTTTGTAATGMGTTNASVTGWPIMTMGANGASVTMLQTWLISKGYTIPAGATGYFGAQTTSALAAYQKASGIMPAVGYFGPLTRAYIASH